MIIWWTFFIENRDDGDTRQLDLNKKERERLEIDRERAREREEKRERDEKVTRKQ